MLFVFNEIPNKNRNAITTTFSVQTFLLVASHTSQFSGKLKSNLVSFKARICNPRFQINNLISSR